MHDIRNCETYTMKSTLIVYPKKKKKKIYINCVCFYHLVHNKLSSKSVVKTYPIIYIQLHGSFDRELYLVHKGKSKCKIT